MEHVLDLQVSTPFNKSSCLKSNKTPWLKSLERIKYKRVLVGLGLSSTVAASVVVSQTQNLQQNRILTDRGFLYKLPQASKHPELEVL